MKLSRKIVVDFLSTNDAPPYSRFVDFLSTIHRYGLISLEFIFSKDVTVSPIEDDIIECNANAFIWANETKQVTLISEGLPGTESTRKRDIGIARFLIFLTFKALLQGCNRNKTGNWFRDQYFYEARFDISELNLAIQNV